MSNIQRHIHQLAALKPSTFPFLSIYAELEPDQYRRLEILDYIEERVSCFRSDFEQSPEQRLSLKRSLEQITDYFRTFDDPGYRGIALFACWDPHENFFLALPLRQPVERRVTVDCVPHIFPLVRFLDVNHHYMVIVSDSEKAKIFEIRFGAIEDVQQIKTSNEQKRFRGEWTQMHYQNWKKDKARRFVKKKIEVLQGLMLSRGIEHLILCGDDVIVGQVKRELPKWLQERLVDISNLGTGSNESEIVARTLRAFADFERIEDQDAVTLLQQEVSGDGLGVVGIERTIEAINQRNVDQLVMLADFNAEQISMCRSCSWLSSNRNGDECTQCESLSFSSVNQREELVRRAVSCGAFVEPITASQWLGSQGGIGALLRYRMSETAGSFKVESGKTGAVS